ncbi:MAG: phosphatase PAP2 family protein, partial [Candidatus Binatia bacterium]
MSQPLVTERKGQTIYSQHNRGSQREILQRRVRTTIPLNEGVMDSAMISLKTNWKHRYRYIRFRFVDFCCLGYMAFIALALPFFHREVADWPVDFLVHVCLVVAALEFIRLGETHPQNKVLWTIRTFYPVAFYSYGWIELDHMVRMFLGSYWATDFLVKADKVIFGVHPTLWAKQLFTPWLDELMSIFYSVYYFFMPLVTLPLYFQGKREETIAAFSIVTFTYFMNFLLFYSLPALGPKMIPWIEELHTAEYTGYLVSSFNRFVQANGSVMGGAFPSSHVSGALVWSLTAWRYNRRFGYLLLPMVLGVAISTVYLGYHHAVDPTSG